MESRSYDKPLSLARVVLRGALTTLGAIVVMVWGLLTFLRDWSSTDDPSRKVGLAVCMGIVTFTLVFVVPGWRDVRYRRPRAVLALFAGAAVAVCVLAGLLIALLASVGSGRTD